MEKLKLIISMALCLSLAACGGSETMPGGSTTTGSTGDSTGGTSGSTSGSATGGSTAGGSTAGGSTAGGSTAGGSTAGGSTAGGSTAGGSTTGGSTAGGPVILSFGTNVSELTYGGNVSFIAVVTVPGGLDKLVGGKLEDPTGKIPYGAFLATSQGSYQLVLTWTEINRSLPIDFVSEEKRDFRAVFFDVDGRQTTQSLQVRLHCNGLGACGGQCTDLSSNRDHCGTCDNQVSPQLVCRDGQAACPDSGATFCSASNTCSLLNDSANCGACGATVEAPRVCSGGMPACPANLGNTWCPATNTCVFPAYDPKNCGGCGHVCSKPGATASCSAGECRYTITVDFSSCDQVCAKAGLTCLTGRAVYTSHETTITCASFPPWQDLSEEYQQLRCTCY